LRYDSSSSFNQNGWELSGQYKFAPWLGAVADFSGDYGSSTHTSYFLFGPQVSWPARASPFGHVLIGGAHVSYSGGPSDARNRKRPSPSRSVAASMRKSPGRFTGVFSKEIGFIRASSEPGKTMRDFQPVSLSSFRGFEVEICYPVSVFVPLAELVNMQ